MEQKKRGRGRPRLDTKLTDIAAPSRRQAINAMYMFEGVQLISEAAAEIPDHQLLWYADDATQTAKSKNGILEQLGRMIVQDRFAGDDCIYIAGLAAAALREGCTSREIEKKIREIRLRMKASMKDPENTVLRYAAGEAVEALRKMGGETV